MPVNFVAGLQHFAQGFLTIEARNTIMLISHYRHLEN